MRVQKNYTFPPRLRIKKSMDFRKVIENGKRTSFHHFVVFRMSNGLGHPRLGVTVSRAVGKAHRRNRVRRLLREFFRLNQHRFMRKEDIVIIAKKGAGQLDYHAVDRELSHLTGE